MADEQGGSAMSGAAETATVSTPTLTVDTSSSASTQATAGTQSATPDSATNADDGTDSTPARRDYATEAKTNADLKAYIDAEANRIAQRQRARDERRAKVRNATLDPDAALELATELDTEMEESDPRVQIARKAEPVLPMLNRLVGNPDFKAVYDREGKAAMDARFQKDPEAYADWVLDQMAETKAAAKARKMAPELARAGAREAENTLFAHTPQPLAGGGGGTKRSFTVAELRDMSNEDYVKNRAAILAAL